jgi:outer membrane receptor protein involved in Fe transport
MSAATLWLSLVLAVQSTGLTMSLAGVVRDSTGAAIPGASVIVRAAGGSEVRATTSADGRFAVTVARQSVEVIVEAPGFARAVQRVVPDDRGGAAAQVDVTLQPATVLEEVTVTASRMDQRLGDVPASVSVVSSAEIQQSPAVVADDLLRQVPTFSLFRRTSSLSSHPTSQGVSLRGIGPSGVSRTLVLLDGVPFNDPFGGWVYWSRVPLEGTDRIEVVDGASSSLYGNYAMGGVINIVTFPPTRRTLEIKPQYGNRNSPKVDVAGSDVWGGIGIAVDGSVFNTDGFPIVVANERGAVDNNASVDFRNFNVKLDYHPTTRASAFLRGGYFRENRNNGKASTINGVEEANDTRWTSASGGARLLLPDDSVLQATLFTDFETFHSNFLAVPTATPPRSIGRMTLNQAVPTTGGGGMAQWSKATGARHSVTAGGDWRWVQGDSNEDGLDTATGTRVTLHRTSGGTQQSLGAFVQDMITPVERLDVTLSARVDHWRNYNAHNLEVNVPSGTPTANNNPALPSRDDTVVSPRAAAIYHVNDRLSAWGDIGGGFRAPTLNELYRQFRVGQVLTLANNQLGPERLVGGEAGINVSATRRLTWRATWFDNSIRNPVSNVTLTTAGANVTQQRQNLGRTQVWGVQTDVEYRITPSWRLAGGYLYDHATVTEFKANPALVGNFLPQVPSHRASLQVVYSNAKYATLAAALQALGRQFDDDQNMRVVPGYTEAGLPKYALVDIRGSREIARNLEVFLGVQNLFNQQYFVGTLPTTIGSPRLVTAGVRVRFVGR